MRALFAIVESGKAEGCQKKKQGGADRKLFPQLHNVGEVLLLRDRQSARQQQQTKQRIADAKTKLNITTYLLGPIGGGTGNFPPNPSATPKEWVAENRRRIRSSATIHIHSVTKSHSVCEC